MYNGGVMRNNQLNSKGNTMSDEQYDDDGQPDEYIEWQDLYGGDDWDHGQYDYC
jgi:hypothetical protein